MAVSEPTYRVYVIGDDGHIQARFDIESVSDADATAYAELLMAGVLSSSGAALARLRRCSLRRRRNGVS
ncbi:hypothetical protein BraRD5C2_67860 [Bradyrhizobium sp. RD5-C2]|nr:hypothetical protein BraRD5C2_67860 [Bradyrhizobium sp. RD5-C2]